MDAGKPQYSQMTDSKSMSVKTELQIVKAGRLIIHGIEYLFKLLFGFIKTMIKEILSPGSSSRV